VLAAAAELGGAPEEAAMAHLSERAGLSSIFGL
jgi:hypothetical protein